MKKKICMILGIIMIMIMIVPVNAAGSTATFTAYKDDEEVSSVNVGDEFSVVLAIEGYSEPTDGVYSYISVAFATPTYDETCFEWTGSEILISNRMLGMVNHNSNIVDGEEQGKQGVVAVAKGVNINTDLVKFTFKALNVTDGSESISFNVYTQDKESKEIDTIPCSITVLGKDFETTPTLTGTDEVTYDGEFHTISVDNLPDGATVAWSCKTSEDGTYVDVESPSFKNAGTYYVKAAVSKAGYNTVTLEGELTIKPKTVTVTVPAVESKIYDGKTAADEIQAALDAAAVNDVATGDTVNATFQNWSVTDNVDAGKYSVAIGVSIDNPNYTLKKETVALDYEIKPMPIMVTIKNATKIVGMNVPTLSFSFKPDVLVNESVIIGSPSVNVTEDVAGKTYDITQGTIAVTPDPDNYELTFEKGTLTVSAKQPTKVTVSGVMEHTSFWEGEPINMDGITVSAEYENGYIEEDVKTFTVYCGEEVGKAPEVYPNGTADAETMYVTIEYLGIQANWSQEVVVRDNFIKSITVDASKAKKVYLVGEPLSKKGLVVTGQYLNESTSPLAQKDPVTLNENQYNLSAYMDEKAASVEVTVTAFNRGDTYTITVMDKYLEGLKVVDTVPTSLSLIEGQTFKLSETGVDVVAVYSDGTEESVKDTFSDVEITKDSVGSVTETLSYMTEAFGSYEGETETCDLTVAFAKKSVTNIEVTNPPKKTNYYTGDTFDPTDAEIKLTYSNGKSEIITKDYGEYGISFSPMKMTDDTKKVTVSAGETSAYINVNVTPVKLESISVDTYKNTYVDGDSISKDDLIVSAKYNNGSTAKIVDYTFFPTTFKLTNEAEAETVTVTVTYCEKDDVTSKTYNVTVKPCVAIIENGSDQTRYASVDEALTAAKSDDTIQVVRDAKIEKDATITGTITLVIDENVKLEQADGTNINVESGSLTVENKNTEDSVDLTINDEKVTVDADNSTTVEPVKDDEVDSTYFAFYLQMLQWRNRTFIVSYKQTEGGTISGANTARFSQSVTFTVTPDEGYAIADVIVNGKSVGAVDSFTIKNIKSNTTVSATFEKIETETVEVEIVPETTPWANPFTDVGEMDAFYTAVQYVYENGLFKGMSNTEFGPAITMNRAMFVTVLGRLTGVNVDDFTTVTFADCEAGSWYAPYVEWAAQAGIVKGMSATEFAPDAEITVEQALTILYRYMTTMGYDLTGADTLTAYADAASVSDWAMEAVQWAVANEIYEVADTLAPQSAAARSLVATMLYNLSGMLAK